MGKTRHPLTQVLEKVEVLIEDILIGFSAILAIIIIIGAFSILVESSTISKALFPGIKGAASGIIMLAMAGYMILPWIIILGLMIIARDLWLVRRVIERAVKFEVTLFEELEKKEKKEKKKKK